MRLEGLNRPTAHLPPPTPAHTMRWMSRLSIAAQKDPQLRLFAEKIVVRLFPHDYVSEYAAVLNWVRTNIRYVRDPLTVEQIKTPRTTLETETGDCDCMSTLIAALISSIGGQTRFVAGSFKTGANKPLTHVWAEAFDPASKAWLILDPVPGRFISKMKSRLTHAVSMPGA